MDVSKIYFRFSDVFWKQSIFYLLQDDYIYNYIETKICILERERVTSNIELGKIQ